MERTKFGFYGLWALKIVAGLAFIAAGAAKLIGAEMMVQTFEAVGVGQWFRYVTGIIEVGGGALLFVPGLQAIGAVLLTATMIGATITHLFVIGGSPVPALVLLVITAVIAWAYRHQLPVGGATERA
ncbi:DoxX family protein [Bauldia sp.]|uniref:DoxX family protein n=1 Tax=Bauldia sp. TaxID=2575872 RepID=UPI003BAA6F62